MDNSPKSWAPRPVLVGTAWALGALAGTGATLAALTGDRGGAVLSGLAGLVLLIFAAHGTLVRPRLAADSGGLLVRAAGGTSRLDWNSARVQLRDTRRLGRDVTTLEVESGDELHVFGWLELGAHPREVIDVLRALRAGQ